MLTQLYSDYRAPALRIKIQSETDRTCVGSPASAALHKYRSPPPSIACTRSINQSASSSIPDSPSASRLIAVAGLPPPPKMDVVAWRRMSQEERATHIRDMFTASMMKHLDIRNEDEDEGESYGVPASKKAILDLYSPPWDEARQEQDGCCVICREGFETDQKFRMMPCYHCFHQPCIFEWLLQNRLCPICQYKLPTEEEQRLVDEERARRVLVRRQKEEARSTDDHGDEDMIVDIIN